MLTNALKLIKSCIKNVNNTNEKMKKEGVMDMGHHFYKAIEPLKVIEKVIEDRVKKSSSYNSDIVVAELNKIANIIKNMKSSN